MSVVKTSGDMLSVGAPSHDSWGSVETMGREGDNIFSENPAKKDKIRKRRFCHQIKLFISELNNRKKIAENKDKKLTKQI